MAGQLQAFVLLLLILLPASHGDDKAEEHIRTIFSQKQPEKRYLSLKRIARALEPDTLENGDDDREPYLNIVEEMQNITAQSEERAIFKCRIDGYPSDNITYTWYKDNLKLEEADLDPRYKIRSKTSVSKLLIQDVFTPDSGLYRCEASNQYRRVHTQAYLTVSFSRLPEGEVPEIDTGFLKGKCEIYKGFACSEFLSDQYIYMESFQDQDKMEEDITYSLKVIAGMPDISAKCQMYAKKAFCYLNFSPCRVENGKPTEDPTPSRLCQEDCDLMKYDICRKEFFQQNSNKFISLQDIVNEADCSGLPPTTSSHTQCTKMGLTSVINFQHKCFNDTGKSYRGTLSVTVNGDTCKTWPSGMLYEHPQLSGGHNFCRNPSGDRETPWCYIDEARTVKEKCIVPLCDYGERSSPDIIVILIPAVSVPLLLGCFVLIFCFACRKKENKTKHTKGIKMENKTISAKKVKVPELGPNLVHIIGELGDGKFGKVYKAQILSNLQYCPNDPVAVKTLHERCTPAQLQDFQREIDLFSSLQHPNVSCMKAIVAQPSLRCMIFEYTNGVDLHEYLVLHSPQADFIKPPSSASSHASSTLEHTDFIRMAIQISAGMEYLTSSNFIHRDLAARNVLICANMELKVCNLGVVRDSYVSSYYRSPQGGQMLPIRWMAPESLQNWQFSDKTTVWSFGVLLWEMFSFGLQPYCGYSNHEVLDMISRRQLLTCPDQCPAKMYSLVKECWSSEPSMRPQFKDIHAKLVGWEGTSTTRMTSQLAQGIHRQLTNVMRDGNSGQYHPQYGPQHGTMVEGIGRPLPPQNYYSPAPGFSAPHSGDPNRLYPGPPTSASSGHSGNSYPQQHFREYGSQNVVPPGHPGMNYPPLPQQQHQQKCPSYSSKSSGSVASSDYNHQALRVNNLSPHPEVPEPDSLSPPTSFQQTYHQQQGRTSRPNLESGYPENEPHSPQRIPRMYVNIDNNPSDVDRNSRPGSGVQPGGRLPLAVYQDQGNSSPSRTKPVLAPKPPVFYGASNSGQYPSENHNSGPVYSPGAAADNARYRVPNDNGASGKATSCDSGLPCDDLDSEGADSHRPLLAAVPGRPGIHSPSKTTLTPPSVSSSVSGATQVTADSRIST